jgi:hypothetical protein
MLFQARFTAAVESWDGRGSEEFVETRNEFNTVGAKSSPCSCCRLGSRNLSNRSTSGSFTICCVQDRASSFLLMRDGSGAVRGKSGVISSKEG